MNILAASGKQQSTWDLQINLQMRILVALNLAAVVQFVLDFVLHFSLKQLVECFFGDDRVEQILFELQRDADGAQQQIDIHFFFSRCCKCL